MGLSFGSIAQVFVGIVALFIPGGQAIGLSLIIGGVLSAAAMLLAPDPHKTETRDSTTYGFGQFRNPVRGDTPIPIIYSPNGHKTAPTWLQCFVTPKGHTDDDSFVSILRAPGQAVSGLLAVCEGPVEDIYDIRINDEPMYEEVRETLGTGNGSQRVWRITRNRVEIRTCRVAVDGVVKGFVATQKSTLLGTGNGSTAVFALIIDHPIATEYGIRFYNQNPARNDKEIYEYSQVVANSVGILPRVWQVSKHKFLVNTQVPMVPNAQLWAEWTEWGTPADLTIVRDQKTDDIVVTFKTAPAAGTAVTVDYRVKIFPGVDVELRYGNDYQLPILGFDTIQNTQGLSQELTQGAFITRDCAQEVDDLILDFASGASGFTSYDDMGDHGPTWAQFEIQIKLQSPLTGNIYNSWQSIYDPAGKRSQPHKKEADIFELWGDSTSQLFWAYSIAGLLNRAVEKDPTNTTVAKRLTDFVRAKYSIRCRRRNENAGKWNSSFVDDLYWSSFREVTNEALNLPGVAIIAFHGMASEKLNGDAPNITCRVKGKANVKKYSAVTRKWTEAPENQGNRVWAIVDLISNLRYGAGEHYTLANVDTASAVVVAAWLDELVSKGNGTTDTEVRSILDYVIDTRRSLMEHIRDIASPGRFWVVLQGGVFKFVKDDAVALKSSTGADLVPVLYDSTSISRVAKNTLVFTHDAIVSRPTEVQVSFLSIAKQFEQKQIWVTLQASANEARRIIRVTAYGIIRPSEATRFAIFIWNYLRRNGPMCTVGVSPAGLHFEAGDVIRVISTKGNADVYLRIRKLEFGSKDFFLRVDAQHYNKQDYAAQNDKAQVTTTSVPQTKAAGIAAATAASGTVPKMAMTATRVA